MDQSRALIDKVPGCLKRVVVCENGHLDFLFITGRAVPIHKGARGAVTVIGARDDDATAAGAGLVHRPRELVKAPGRVFDKARAAHVVRGREPGPVRVDGDELAAAACVKRLDPRPSRGPAGHPAALENVSFHAGACRLEILDAVSEVGILAVGVPERVRGTSQHGGRPGNVHGWHRLVQRFRDAGRAALVAVHVIHDKVGVIVGDVSGKGAVGEPPVVHDREGGCPAAKDIVVAAVRVRAIRSSIILIGDEHEIGGELRVAKGQRQ